MKNKINFRQSNPPLACKIMATSMRGLGVKLAEYPIPPYNGA